MIPSPALPRYVELVRVSSSGQAERDTPQDQRAALERLREARPGILVERIEVAEGVSGALSADERPDLRRLFALARERAFDEVRVRHIDRLTRHGDPRERFAVYGAVADAGAVIVDGGGRVIDPRSELGELDYYFQTLMASRERKRIAERTRAGKIRLAAQGRLVQGRPPFARRFDRASGAWSIDEEEAALARRIFTMCLDGRSLRQIAGALNAEGIATPTGREWSPVRVSMFLHDPAAAGRYETYGCVLQIPPVVDEATFRAAGERLRANNAMSGPRPVTPALLRKLVTCGECGAPLYVTKGGKSGARHYYYRCASGGPCVVYHRVERVDAAVRSAVEEWLRRPANLRAAAERDRPEDEAAEASEAAEKATTELRDLDRQEERVARLLRRALISEATGEKQLGEIARLRATAEAERASAEARAYAASRRGKVSAEMEARIASLREGLAHATAEDWRALLEILFPRTAATGIRLHPDGEITLAGALSLDAAGEAAMSRAGRAPAEATVIPLRLRAHR